MRGVVIESVHDSSKSAQTRTAPPCSAAFVAFAEQKQVSKDG
jgi:hypothetical protein